MADSTNMDTYKAKLAELYEPESRPEVVKSALVSLGAEKVLARVGIINGSAESIVDTIASMTTVSGLMEKKTQVAEIAAPYIEKAKDAEGRKELAAELAEAKLVMDGKAILDEKVVEPLMNKASAIKEYVAPYVASVKETASPYVAKLEEYRRSERVEAMISAFQAAREHPAEKVAELKEKAVDLIKYENLKAYREHVMSAEFQEDTMRLIKVDLPEIAASAAKRGADTLKAKAEQLKTELDAYKELGKEKATMYYAMGKEKIPTKEELEAMGESLKVTGALLVAELQAELASGVETYKADGLTYADVVERLKRVVGIVDKIVVKPTLAMLPLKGGECACDGAAACNGVDEKPIVTGASVASTDDEAEMKDAVEEPEVM